MTKESSKSLVYHWPSECYGRGVCGTHGMMMCDFDKVTCERCLRSAQFLAAANVINRYEGQQP